MIGTEAGVGVRNQGGQLQAGKTLAVSSEGKLSWQSGAHEALTQAAGISALRHAAMLSITASCTAAATLRCRAAKAS